VHPVDSVFVDWFGDISLDLIKQRAPKQIKAPAQHYKLPENLLEGGPIVAPKIGDGLEFRLQAAPQPNDLDITMGLGSQLPA